MAKRDRAAVCRTCGHLKVWHDNGGCTVTVGILPAEACPCQAEAVKAANRAGLAPKRQTPA